MEVLLKKRTSLKLDNRLCLMIDNAYYQCKPKEEGDELHRKEKDPLDVFLSDVLYVNLNREKALLLLRKLDWNESLAKKIIAHKFYKPEKFKFSQLDIAADLISDISVYHPDFVIQVVDNLVESVRQGLENNVFKENQKRVAQVKFLAELVNSKILELAFVFDLLYLILTWGYGNNSAVVRYM
jgi:regulator of nonsense transcripts 2